MKGYFKTMHGYPDMIAPIVKAHIMQRKLHSQASVLEARRVSYVVLIWLRFCSCISSSHVAALLRNTEPFGRGAVSHLCTAFSSNSDNVENGVAS